MAGSWKTRMEVFGEVLIDVGFYLLSMCLDMTECTTGQPGTSTHKASTLNPIVSWNLHVSMFSLCKGVSIYKFMEHMHPKETSVSTIFYNCIQEAWKLILMFGVCFMRNVGLCLHVDMAVFFSVAFTWPSMSVPGDPGSQKGGSDSLKVE